MNKLMHKTLLLAAALLATAGCGRLIDADSFSFGGVGHPDELPPEAMTGGGTVELIKMHANMDINTSPFGEEDLFLGSTILNATPIVGFAGSRVLLASPVLPGKPTGGCYRDMHANNFIDGSIDFVNLGLTVDLDAIDDTGNPQSLPLDRVTFGSTDQDGQVFYANGFLGFAVGWDTPLAFAWDGPQPGEELPFGATTCPPDTQTFEDCIFDSNTAINGLQIHPQLMGPGNASTVLVNKVPIGDDTDGDGNPGPVAMADDGWLFEWEPGPAETVTIVLQLYGEEAVFNVGVASYTEGMFLQDYSNLVCTTHDSNGSYFLSREVVSDWYRRFLDNPNFAKDRCTDDGGADDDFCWRGEDGDADGQLAADEDFNGNGQIDPVAGLGYMIFRQTLYPFQYNSSEKRGVTAVARSVSMEYGRLDWRYGDPL